jgi:hypothetical protein
MKKMYGLALVAIMASPAFAADIEPASGQLNDHQLL